MATKEKFEIHPAVIRQLIENQAGTLSKAVLEGVMNGVDAMYEDDKVVVKNPRVDIDLTTTGLKVRDNGRGFQSREEIELVFKVFGLPHVEGDAKFGRFRIGRGQLFAQGKTTYTSNQFKMFVDYRGDGEDLGYEFDEGGAYGDGVTVEVDFYDDMLPRHGDFHATLESIEEAVRYLQDVEVYLNGELVSNGLEEETWTREDEFAYYRLDRKSSWGNSVKIYNQGVYVEDIPSHDWGVSGVIVSKVVLPLNQARNQVRRSVKVWNVMRDTCREYAGATIRAKKTMLEDHEIQAMLKDMATHPPAPLGGWIRDDDERKEHQRAWDGVENLHLFQDANGHMWSMNMINRQAGKVGDIARLDDNKIAIAFAEIGSVKACDAVRSKRAIVLDEKLLKRFKTDGQGFIDNILGAKYRDSRNKFRAVTITELFAHNDNRFTTLTENQLRPREKWVLKALSSVSHSLYSHINREAGLSWHERKPRRLVVGVGPADAWTDGANYVAVSRTVIEDMGQMTPGNFERLVALVTWQYCWDTSNQDSSRASAEQKDLFADLIQDVTSGYGYLCWQNYVNILDREGKKLPADQMRRVRQIEEAGEIEYAYVMWKDGDEDAFLQTLHEVQDEAAG